MTQAMHNLAVQAHPAAPITIYYAFKQSETEDETGTSSTGWETFLDAVLSVGLRITGTWPMRTENANRMRRHRIRTLSPLSIVLVCRPRRRMRGTDLAPRSSARAERGAARGPRRDDPRERGTIDSPVAPVDLSQAIIGPGMAVFSSTRRARSRRHADERPDRPATHQPLPRRGRLRRRHAVLPALVRAARLGDGKFGEADTLARAKGTSVDGVKHAGVIESGGGIVRLLKWAEYPADWDPATDRALPVWEVLHQLIRAFKTDGESGAAERARRRAGQGRGRPAACLPPLHALRARAAGPRTPAPTTR